MKNLFSGLKRIRSMDSVYCCGLSFPAGQTWKKSHFIVRYGSDPAIS